MFYPRCKCKQFIRGQMPLAAGHRHALFLFRALFLISDLMKAVFSCFDGLMDILIVYAPSFLLIYNKAVAGKVQIVCSKLPFPTLPRNQNLSAIVPEPFSPNAIFLANLKQLHILYSPKLDRNGNIEINSGQKNEPGQMASKK